MKIGIANDHHGVEVKQNVTKKLIELGYNVVDYGTDSSEMVDYPFYAFKVGEAVVKKEIDFGILFCSSGIGMSIACNKVKGVRCGRVSSIKDTIATRKDNDANIIAFSGEINAERALRIIEEFINTEFNSDERHLRRINIISKYER